MKQLCVIFLLSCVLVSCSWTTQEISQTPNEENQLSDIQEPILPIHEASTDAEIEFSQALDNLLNEIANEQE